MLSAVSGCLQMPARKLGTFYAARSVTKNSLIQSRTMILIGSEKDSEKLYTSQMFDYANDIERMGCNDHPHFKREHLKGYDWKRMRRERKAKKMAHQKVSSLLDYIKMQDFHGRHL